MPTPATDRQAQGSFIRSIQLIESVNSDECNILILKEKFG